MSEKPKIIEFFFSAAFRGHDLEHHVVGLAHSIGTNTRQVMDAAVDVVVDDAFRRGDALALHGEQRGEQGGGDP